MTSDEVKAFLSQFQKAKEEFARLPKWMRRESRMLGATFPSGKPHLPYKEKQ